MHRKSGYAQLGNQLAVVGQLGGGLGVHVGAVQVSVLKATLGQQFLHSVRVDSGLRSGLQDVNDLLGGVLGNSEAAPSLDGDVDAHLGSGLNVGHHGGAGLAQDAQNLEVAGVHVVLHLRGADSDSLDVAAQQSSNSGSSAVEGNVSELNAALVLDGGGGNVPDGAGAGVTDLNLAGMLLGVVNELLEGVPRSVGANGDSGGDGHGRQT